jgi:hypothetical protein
VRPRIASVCILLIASNCSSHSGETDERVETLREGAAPTVVLAAFKAAHALHEVAKSVDLQNTYATLLQAHADVHFGKGAALDDLAPPLPSFASDAQATAHGTLTQLLQGRWLAVWDATRATPGYVHLEHPIVAADGTQAKSAFDTSLGALVTDLYQVEAPHEMTLVDSRTIALDDSEELVAHRFRYKHLYDGVVVDGDRLDLTLRPLDDQTSAWIPVIGARWTRDIALQTTDPVLTPEQAAEAALASGELDQGQLLAEPKLVIVTHGAPTLVYRVRIGDGIGQWSYHVDAATGEVVSVSNQTLHNSGSSGSLSIMVSRPHEGNTKHARPLPHVRIWKDELETQSLQGCDITHRASQWIGDNHLGTTTYGGQYWDVGSGISDDWWTVDYRGTWMWDRSVASHSPDLTMPFFLKGTEHTFPAQEIHNRGRRGEIYYLTTHAARAYSAYGIAQYKPLVFNYTGKPAGNDVCQNPQSVSHLLSCCVGKADSCMNVDCLDMGTVAPAESERRFRQVTLHEHNHTISWYDGDSFCNGITECGVGPSQPGPECFCWDEGRADYGGLALSKLEVARPEYRPDLQYPNDLINSYTHPYGKGAVWTAIYGEHLLTAGYREGIRAVHDHVGLPDNDTVMVGDCQGSSSIGNCPINSFHYMMLYSDFSLAPSKQQTTYEIAKVFHQRVTDAVPGGPIDPFPWADELSKRARAPHFAALEFGDDVVLTHGPDPGSGLIRFALPDDSDVVMFLAREGKTYTVETFDLMRGVDTVLELLADDGSETIVQQNDDCTLAELRSCITFTATDTGWVRVRALRYPGSTYGTGATYKFGLRLEDDDYGDTPQSAAALVADLEPRTAEIDFPGDHDVFRLASSEPQTLEYWICPPNGGFTPRVQVLDENETVIATMTNNNCGASNSTVSIGAGIYYLRARAVQGSATGAYQIRALLTSDIDVDSTPANAWELAVALATPAEGEVVGARFESAQDEDWYSFTTAYDSFNFVVETYAPPGGSADTMLEVYAPPETIFGRTGTLDSLPDTSGHGIGHWMLQDHGGALSPGGSRLAFLTPAAGTYYIRVRNMGGNDAPYYLAFHRSSVVSSLLPHP